MIYSNSATESALKQQGLLVWRGEIHLHFTTSPQGHSTTCLKKKIKIQPLHGITVLLKLITMHGHQNTINTKCTIGHEEVLCLQPLIPPKRFDIFSPTTGGCSEGLGVLRFSFKKIPLNLLHWV